MANQVEGGEGSHAGAEGMPNELEAVAAQSGHRLPHAGVERTIVAQEAAVDGAVGAACTIGVGGKEIDVLEVVQGVLAAAIRDHTVGRVGTPRHKRERLELRVRRKERRLEWRRLARQAARPVGQGSCVAAKRLVDPHVGGRSSLVVHRSAGGAEGDEKKRHMRR